MESTSRVREQSTKEVMNPDWIRCLGLDSNFAVSFGLGDSLPASESRRWCDKEIAKHDVIGSGCFASWSPARCSLPWWLSWPPAVRRFSSQLLLLRPTTSSTESGVFTSGDASVSKKPDTAFLYAGVESQQPSASRSKRPCLPGGKADRAGQIARGRRQGPQHIGLLGRTGLHTRRPDRQRLPSVGAASDHMARRTQRWVRSSMRSSRKAERRMSARASAWPTRKQPRQRRGPWRSPMPDPAPRPWLWRPASGSDQVIRVSDLTSSGLPSGGLDVGAAAPAATQLPVGDLTVTVTVEVDFAIA